MTISPVLAGPTPHGSAPSILICRWEPCLFLSAHNPHSVETLFLARDRGRVPSHLIATYIAGGTSPLLDDFAIGRDASPQPALKDARHERAVHGLDREQTG